VRGGSEQTITGSPHPINTLLLDTLQSNGYSSRGVLEIASGPVPFVSAQAFAHNTRGEISGSASGSLYYQFSVNGPALSFVSVNFRSVFAVSAFADIIPNANIARAVVSAQIGNATFTISPTTLRNEGIMTYGSLPGTSSWFNTQLAGTPAFESWSGVMLGGTSIATDANGYGVGLVLLHAEAFAYAQVSQLDMIGTAYIDSELRLDEVWLAANPGASLTLREGVGNEVSSMAVPEPGMVFGVLGLFLLSQFVRCRRPAF